MGLDNQCADSRMFLIFKSFDEPIHIAGSPLRPKANTIS